jgi:RNA polymerase sigma-19 factor, ECF subfamily
VGNSKIEEAQNGLIRRLRLSDEAAFSEIFDSFHAPLLRYVRQILRDEDESYDVLQDVFSKLWEGRHELVVHTSLKALLYRMARNRALNVLRKNDRMIAESQMGRLPDVGDTTASAESVLVAGDLAGRIRDSISLLPPRRAEAFVLSRYHGLSADEISKLMDLSKRTVETHILHALRDLRERLKVFESTGGNA